MRPGFWRKCRVCFRWFRITMLMLVLAAVCAFVWVNRIGLPDFLKTRLVQALHSRGMDLEFSRMRLRVMRGIVAENVRIGDARIAGSPSLSLEEIQLRLDHHALLHWHLQIDGLILRQGELNWPIPQSRSLALDDIHASLRFQTNDTWSLNNFSARFAGAQINLSGEIAHAPEISRWEIFQGRKSTSQPEQLQKFLDQLAKIHFDGSPQLSLIVNGDARNIRSFTVQLGVVQSQTRLELDGAATDGPAGTCRWRVHGALHPEFARPFLAAADAASALDILTFNRPVFLDVAGRNRLDDPGSISAAGHVALTNFMVRNESFGKVSSAFVYTNQVLQFLNPLMQTRRQMMTADSVTLNFGTRMLYFTNGFSTADPESIARAIGAKTGQIVEPYRFLEPPGAWVNGQIPLRDLHGGSEMADVDLKFDVINGAPFEWMKFHSTNVTGTIHWQGTKLVVTNVLAAFYEGRANGFANFDFQVPHEGADYDFAVNVENANLHRLAVDLSSPTNSLEGTLAGRLVVTHGDTRDWRTWNGYGNASLHDGLIWEIPLFGILSPALNKVWPGLGNSRATDATARFAITNGLFYTDSLEIRSTMTRLRYVGTIDLDQKVNAHVTAEPLRDTSVVGPLVTTVLWPVSKLFEYKISGTLQDPKSDLIYWPKFLLMPLHPIRSFEGIFPSGAFSTAPPDN